MPASGLGQRQNCLGGDCEGGQQKGNLIYWGWRGGGANVSLSGHWPNLVNHVQEKKIDSLHLEKDMLRYGVNNANCGKIILSHTSWVYFLEKLALQHSE